MHYLSGGSEHDPSEYYGRKIEAASIAEDSLTIRFADGVTINLWDNGQSCCEYRHMTTDDEVSFLVGKTLRLIEVKKHESKEDVDYGEHEMAFVEVGVDDGCITIVNHNEHNGYYGGFGLTITEKQPTPDAAGGEA